MPHLFAGRFCQLWLQKTVSLEMTEEEAGGTRPPGIMGSWWREVSV